MMFYSSDKNILPSAEQALPGRGDRIFISSPHYVLKQTLNPPFPPNCDRIIFGLGCFWGAERIFWQLEGVFTTAVGYAGGYTENPNYREVCSGQTAHCEVVLVVFDPAILSLIDLLIAFWEGHDPTQGMRQGNDRGSQYRSAIYPYTASQSAQALQTRDHYQKRLSARGLSDITTEIEMASEFYYAEELHQQYLAKNPTGYCGICGTNVAYNS